MTTVPTTVPPPAPTLNGLIIGQAERATRAVLDRLLAEHDTPFETWVTINLLAQAGGQQPSDDLIARMIDGLRIAEIDVWAAIDDARRRQLATGTDQLHLTDLGRQRFDVISEGTRAITARLYADLPAEQLEVAATVLLTITARARAELDAPR
jgi:hypothetical protein